VAEKDRIKVVFDKKKAMGLYKKEKLSILRIPVNLLSLRPPLKKLFK
jgi:hypothetical protein